MCSQNQGQKPQRPGLPRVPPVTHSARRSVHQRGLLIAGEAPRSLSTICCRWASRASGDLTSPLTWDLILSLPPPGLPVWPGRVRAELTGTRRLHNLWPHGVQGAGRGAWGGHHMGPTASTQRVTCASLSAALSPLCLLGSRTGNPAGGSVARGEAPRFSPPLCTLSPQTPHSRTCVHTRNPSSGSVTAETQPRPPPGTLPRAIADSRPRAGLCPPTRVFPLTLSQPRRSHHVDVLPRPLLPVCDFV